MLDTQVPSSFPDADGTQKPGKHHQVIFPVLVERILHPQVFMQAHPEADYLLRSATRFRDFRRRFSFLRERRARQREQQAQSYRDRKRF